MSRVGKAPVQVPNKVKVKVDGRTITVTGPKGELKHEVHPDITVAMQGSEVVVTRSGELKKHRALHGLTRALINNMVIGVLEGYKTELEMIGVGYRAESKGKILIMHLGYSHPIFFIPPAGITVSLPPKTNMIVVEGIDKQLVGEVAAKIRSFRKPEPYKGKGIRYIGEHVRTKAGKAAVGTGT